MSVGRNYALHMAKGAVSVAGKSFCKNVPEKVSSQRNVNTVDQSGEDDVYVLREAPLKKCASDQFMTLKLQKSGNFMKFQLDTGAECNVVPLEMYKEVTGDVLLSKVVPSMDAIVAFGGSKMLLAGCVLLQCHVVILDALCVAI